MGRSGATGPTETGRDHEGQRSGRNASDRRDRFGWSRPVRARARTSNSAGGGSTPPQATQIARGPKPRVDTGNKRREDPWIRSDEGRSYRLARGTRTAVAWAKSQRAAALGNLGKPSDHGSVVPLGAWVELALDDRYTLCCQNAVGISLVVPCPHQGSGGMTPRGKRVACTEEVAEDLRFPKDFNFETKGRQHGSLMTDSPLKKMIFPLARLLSKPRTSLSWVRRGHLAKDEVFVSQTNWFTGVLPRVALSDAFPETKQTEVYLPHAFDRRFDTSITAEEACHLAAVAKCRRARKVLEIGTYDGNTALLLAANLGPEGSVVTVDLPPDFDLENQRSTLAYPDGEIYLTPRELLGRQYRGHPLAARITQVYGDSASLDWATLGGPFDLIFVDGCHTEAYVRSDSRNALAQLTADGAIVWHDYGMIPDVSVVVDQIAREVPTLKIYALKGTRLALGVNTGRPSRALV